MGDRVPGPHDAWRGGSFPRRRGHRETVPERDFYLVLKGFRDVRAMAVRKDLDAWAFRQAIITALAMDTQAALERGVRQEDLDSFDAVAEEEIQKWLRTVSGK